LTDDAAIILAARLLGKIGEGDAEEVRTLVSELCRCERSNDGINSLVENAVGLAERYLRTDDHVRSISGGGEDVERPGDAGSLGLFDRPDDDPLQLQDHLDRLAAGDYSPRTSPLGRFAPTFDALCASLRRKDELEDRLRESEELLRTVITASPDEIATTDLQGNLTFVSGAGLRLFGLASKAEALGRNIASFLVPEHRERAARGIAAMTAGRNVVSEYQALRSNGDKFWIEINGGIVQGADSRPLKLLFVVRDITWRKDIERELERSEGRYRTLVETATMPIFILGPDSSIHYMNERGKGLLGIPGGEPGGRFLDYADGPTWAGAIIGLFDSMEGGVRDGEVQLRGLGGRKVWAHISARRIDLDGVPALFLYCNDITEAKRAEEQLALANRKLALLGSVTRHDVLNRLTALNGLLELVYLRTTDDVVRRYVEKAKQSSLAIQKQMELTRTYQDVGTMEPGWIDVTSAVEVDLASMDLGKVRVQLGTDRLEVMADPLFVACIHNIVRNSLKHGGVVQRVMISARETPTGLVLAIEDDGKGIPASQKQAIFDWNYNGRSGHGLNFVREVLNSTGMEVRETGAEGRGARFEIMVPHGLYRFKE